MGGLRMLAAAALAFALAALPARATGDIEWVLVRVTAGPEGAQDAAFLGGYFAEVTGPGPVVLGTVAGVGGVVRGDAQVLGDDPQSISTSDDLGGIRVVLSEVPVRGSFYSYGGYSLPPMTPGEVIVLAWIVTGSRIVEHVVEDASATPGQIALEVATGAGSGTVEIVGTGSRGPAVQALGAAAGVVRTPLDVPAGIIGAFAEDCTRCDLGWSSPDGRGAGATGTRVCAGAVVIACVNSENLLGFAGPGGEWHFTFGGIREPVYSGAPVLSLYAQVGDLWSAFTGPLD